MGLLCSSTGVPSVMTIVRARATTARSEPGKKRFPRCAVSSGCAPLSLNGIRPAASAARRSRSVSTPWTTKPRSARKSASGSLTRPIPTTAAASASTVAVTASLPCRPRRTLDELAEAVLEADRGRPPEHLARLDGVGDPPPDVGREARHGAGGKRPAGPTDLEEQLRELEDRRLATRAEVEVLIDGALALHGDDDAARDVAHVRVAARLPAVAEDLERMLAGADLLDEIRDDVRLADLLAGLLARTEGVEGTDDRVPEPVLVREGAAVPLAHELAEAVRRERRRNVVDVLLAAREPIGRFVDHRRRDEDHSLDAGVGGGLERVGVYLGVLGQDGCRIAVEVADPADAGREIDAAADAVEERAHARRVREIDADEVAARRRPAGRLAQVVGDADGVAALAQLPHDLRADKTAPASHQDNVAVARHRGTLRRSPLVFKPARPSTRHARRSPRTGPRSGSVATRARRARARAAAAGRTASTRCGNRPRRPLARARHT